MFVIGMCLVLFDVYMYLDHLKLCVVCINDRRNVCCGGRYVVSNECDEPTSQSLLSLRPSMQNHPKKLALKLLINEEITSDIQKHK